MTSFKILSHSLFINHPTTECCVVQAEKLTTVTDNEGDYICDVVDRKIITYEALSASDVYNNWRMRISHY
jgi:hypothetical protein